MISSKGSRVPNSVDPCTDINDITGICCSKQISSFASNSYKKENRKIIIKCICRWS